MTDTGLDAASVESAVDGIAGVVDAIAGGAGAVAGEVASTVSSVIETVDGAASNYVSAGISSVSAVTASPQSPRVVAQGLLDDMASLIQGIWETLQVVADRARRTVSDTIAAILPSTLDALIATAANAGALTSGLLTNLATVQEAGEGIAEGAVSVLSGQSTVISDWLTAHVLPWLTGLAEGPAAAAGNAWLQAIASGTQPARWPAEVAAVVQQLDTVGALRNPLVILMGIAGYLVGASSAAASGALAEISAVSADVYRPSRLTPGEAALAVRRGFAQQQQLIDAAARSGLDDTSRDTLYRLTESLLSAGDIISLRRRGVITPEDADAELDRLGYTGPVRVMLNAAAEVQPTPQDLVTFLVRDVFNPHTRAAFRLDEDYPERADAEFAKLGVAPELARNYWASHWGLPSATQGFEMFQRTSDRPTSPYAEAITLPGGRTVYRVVSREVLGELLKAKDISPGWREPLTQIAYAPLTRVDVRRMHKLGVLDRDGVIKAHLDLGYDIDNAVALARFVEALNQEEDAATKESQRAGVKSAVAAALVNGSLGEGDARQLLQRAGYTEAQVGEIVAAAHLRAATERADGVRAAYRRAFLAGSLDRSRVTAGLAGAGFSDAEISHLLSLWATDVATRDYTDAERQQRDLSKAEVLAAYESRVLTPDEARSLLARLGYDEREVDVLVATSDARQAKATTQALIDSVRVRFVAGKLPRATAVVELDHAGVPATQRDALLSRWELDVRSATADIPLSTLSELAAKGIVSEGDLLTELARRGYDERERAWLAALWVQRRAERTAAEERRLAAEERARQAEIRRVEAQFKDLSKGDIQASYVEGLVTYETARAELVGIGYSDAEAHRLLALAGTEIDRRRAAEARRVERELAAEERARQAEIRRAKTAAERAAKEAAARAEREARERKRLEERAERERRAREKDLARRDVESSYVLGVITRAAAAAELGALGYDDREVTRILLLIDTKRALEATRG